MTEIERLDKEIHEQREENVKLYSIFQYRLHEEDMQPLIKEWRDGGNHLKQLISRRNMFIQRYWYSEPIRTIAQLQGKSESTVKVTLHRMRKELKLFLENNDVEL